MHVKIATVMHLKNLFMCLQYIDHNNVFLTLYTV